MALTDLVESLVQKLIAKVLTFLGPFGKVFDSLGKVFTRLRDAFPKAIALFNLIVGEVTGWRTFHESLPYRTGVISLPAAVEKTQELLDQIKAAWLAIKNVFGEIKKALKGGLDDPAIEAEEISTEIETAGAEGLAKIAPRLAKVGEKIAAFLAVLLGVLDSFATLVDDITEVVKAIKGIREEIEFGATIFLQQKNPRRTVHLDDGTSMKIRVGNLHS